MEHKLFRNVSFDISFTYKPIYMVGTYLICMIARWKSREIVWFWWLLVRTRTHSREVDILERMQIRSEEVDILEHERERALEKLTSLRAHMNAFSKEVDNLEHEHERAHEKLTSWRPHANAFLSTAWICLGLHRIEWSTKSTCHNICTKGYYNILLISDFSTEIAYINTWFQQVASRKIP